MLSSILLFIVTPFNASLWVKLKVQFNLKKKQKIFCQTLPGHSDPCHSL